MFEASDFCHNFSIVSIFHCLIYICAYKFIHFNNHIDPLLLNKDSIKLFFVFEASEFCHNFSIVSIVCTYPSYMLISLSISLRIDSSIWIAILTHYFWPKPLLTFFCVWKSNSFIEPSIHDKTNNTASVIKIWKCYVWTMPMSTFLAQKWVEFDMTQMKFCDSLWKHFAVKIHDESPSFLYSKPACIIFIFWIQQKQLIC